MERATPPQIEAILGPTRLSSALLLSRYLDEQSRLSDTGISAARVQNEVEQVSNESICAVLTSLRRKSNSLSVIYARMLLQDADYDVPLDISTETTRTWSLPRILRQQVGGRIYASWAAIDDLALRVIFEMDLPSPALDEELVAAWSGYHRYTSGGFGAENSLSL